MKRILLIGIGRWVRIISLDKSALLGHESLRCLESLVQIVPRLACGALDEIEKDPIRNRRIKLTAYEHTRTYRYHVDRKRISVSRSGLELSHGPWLCRERSFLDAFFCPMACLRAAGRKRHPDIVLVLEHRRQCDHVLVLYFQTRPRRYSSVSSKLTDLHSQSNADPERPTCSNRCGAFSKTARNRVLSTLWTQAGLTVERSDLVNGHSGALANDYGFADSPAGKFAAFHSIAIRIRERPLG
jgi:hypothetical protein